MLVPLQCCVDAREWGCDTAGQGHSLSIAGIRSLTHAGYLLLRHLQHHFRLTRELEKKFSDRHVVFVAQRRMLRKPTRTSRVKQKRPRSRTLTNVHEKILEDLVFPTEIVGKRTRVNQDGSKLLKVCVAADPFLLLPFPSTCRSFYISLSQNWVFSRYLLTEWR